MKPIVPTDWPCLNSVPCYLKPVSPSLGLVSCLTPYSLDVGACVKGYCDLQRLGTQVHVTEIGK